MNSENKILFFNTIAFLIILGITGLLSSSQYLFVLPEILFLNGLLFSICYIVFFRGNNSSAFSIQSSVFFFIKSIAIVSILAFIWTKFGMEFVNYDKVFLFNDQILIDWPTYFFKILLLLLFLAISIIFQSYCKAYKFYNFEILLIMVLGFVGSLIILSSFDLLILYVAIELQALAFYALAAFKTNSVTSTESAIKYFILGAFASIIWLWGVSFVYGSTGLTNFLQLGDFMTAVFVYGYYDSALFFGVLFITLGFLFKLGVAPFHVWVPDVYQGSPLPVTAFFSTVPKLSLTFIIIKFYFLALGSVAIIKISATANFEFVFVNIFSDYLNCVLLGSGLLSVFLGSFVGVGQHNIKRLLAYSSIGNVGFVILALGCGTVYGFQSAILYLIAYLLLTINFFGILLLIKVFRGVSVFSISNFSEINSPILGVLLSLNLFSLAGIPPLMGFYTKLFVYMALLDRGYVILTILIAICTIFSTFYYVRLVALIFFIPSLRAFLTSFIALPTLFDSSYVRSSPHFSLIYLSVFTSLINIFVFLNIDYLLLLVTKLVLLFF